MISKTDATSRWPLAAGHRPKGFRCQITEVRGQNSENREPQNSEQGIMNVEGKENFIISGGGGFDIRYSKLKNEVSVTSRQNKGL
jgi:hypothetical protein